jgi:RNA polymerase sigma factor (sigma-70 family)
MSIRVSGAALGEIRRLFGSGAMGSWTDSQLVDEFLAGQEESEAAFRVLIHRHGPMVLGVCRRILGDEHAAEDAFQATFLVLVKKAGMLRDRGLLTNWLYGVALKVSHKERTRGERRKVVERHAAEQAPRLADGPDGGELRSLIDEEIRRLPEHYRVPLLLCHVEGLRHDEVARRLGCPVGTVESRLSRARERLRSRLARRGLAPSASALGAMLSPPRTGGVSSSLVESTLRAALKHIGPKATLLVAARAVLGRARRASADVCLGTGSAAAGIVLCLGIAGIGLGILRAREPRPEATPVVPVAAVQKVEEPPPEPIRTPQAVARPMSGITIDGRLDDWPEGLPRYPIRNLLTRMPGSYRDTIAGPLDNDADFMVGYDTTAGLIYLAVVVRDDDPVIKQPSSARDNDAVEVYVDGNFSDRSMELPESGDWPAFLDAAKMPVLQYVGLASKRPAYGDRFGANPSLVYSRTREPHTRMKYRSDGRVTTYEWAVKVYDRFPDRPTNLDPGKRIGLEIAVVDKDSDRADPAFLTWGSPPKVFKGFDARSLGELFLAGGP